MKITKEPSNVTYYYWYELEIGDFFDFAGDTFQKISNSELLQYCAHEDKCVHLNLPLMGFLNDRTPLIKLKLEHLVLRRYV